MMKALLFVALTLVYLVGCESNGVQTPSSNDTPVLLTDQRINVMGAERNYHLYLPGNPQSAPIVVLLHGNRGSSNQLLGLPEQFVHDIVAPNKIWLDIALRENLILVVPDGSVGPEGHQGWNDCRSDDPGNPSTDDALFIKTLIDEVSQNYRRTQSKLFAVGISNGGIMSMRLANEMPNQLNAFAAIVASRPINTQCTDPAIPVSALIMNGTADPILPYQGGHIRPRRGELFSTADTVSYWVNRNQANTVNAAVEIDDLNRNDNSVVKVYSYVNGMNNTRVMHYEIVGGGHTEPSIEEQYGSLYKQVVGE